MSIDMYWPYWFCYFESIKSCIVYALISHSLISFEFMICKGRLLGVALCQVLPSRVELVFTMFVVPRLWQIISARLFSTCSLSWTILSQNIYRWRNFNTPPSTLAASDSLSTLSLILKPLLRWLFLHGTLGTAFSCVFHMPLYSQVLCIGQLDFVLCSRICGQVIVRHAFLYPKVSGLYVT